MNKLRLNQVFQMCQAEARILDQGYGIPKVLYNALPFNKISLHIALCINWFGGSTSK